MVILPHFYTFYAFPFIIFLVATILFAISKAKKYETLALPTSIALLLWIIAAIAVGMSGVLFTPNGPPIPLLFMLSGLVLGPSLFLTVSRFKVFALSIPVHKEDSVVFLYKNGNRKASGPQSNLIQESKEFNQFVDRITSGYCN